MKVESINLLGNATQKQEKEVKKRPKKQVRLVAKVTVQEQKKGKVDIKV
jgi:hypothetical protein